MRPPSTQAPPRLLSLTIDSALLHISHFCDLSSVPDPILLQLFSRTLQAGKLTEKVLKLFTDTGSEEILNLIQSLNIRQILTPVLPTRCSEKF
ncbi:UDP-arabinopyranose mutase [Rhynchospora pubera]|uniref:UDP-arabinopyranose mutase n=1 Tax=Rhynchospora pubera TaxID=906938 RepID=A0AAV8F761_9POAL|nr:UDP-arabinopyranose mutase [Rhynchospora pubera]KAJ4786638.1 UDP-arabinopyranose mutase [Rhynchospora pubera]